VSAVGPVYIPSMNDFAIPSSSRRWRRVGLIAGAFTGLLLAFLLQRTALIGCGMLAGILAGRAIDIRRNVPMLALYITLMTLVVAAAAYIALRRF